MLYDSIRLIEGATVSNLTVASGASFPSNASTGELFFKTTDQLMYVYDGSAWVTMGGGGGGSGTVTSVGVTSTTNALTVSGSPITSSGSISITANTFTSSQPGVVAASGGGTTNFLRADGAWSTPVGFPSMTGNANALLRATTGSDPEWETSLKFDDSSSKLIITGSVGFGAGIQGTGATGFRIEATQGPLNLDADDGAMTLAATTTMTMRAGGDVSLTGGYPSGSGDVYLFANGTGNINNTTDTGYFSVVTDGTSRLRIYSSGAWQVNGSYGTTGQVLTSQGSGAAPIWAAAAAAAASLTGTTLAANVVTSSLTSVGTITSGTWSGSFGAVSGANLTSLNAGNISTGTLAVARGGTNFTGTPTAGGVAVGIGTGFSFTAAGTAGQILTSNGTSAPTWQAAPAASKVVGTAALGTPTTVTQASLGLGLGVNNLPALYMINATPAANSRWSQLYMSNTGQLIWQFTNDGGSSPTTFMEVNRSSNAPTTVRFNGTTVEPFTDNTTTLGAAAKRWSVVYSNTGTINTSDANEKEQIATLDVVELQVATAIKGLIKKFKFKDAVAAKGAAARIHIGAIAQEVQAAFTAHGLDASDYGMFCEDVWYELDGETSDTYFEGSIQKSRLGLRYEELLAFVIAAL